MDNIKIKLIETGIEDVNYIHVVDDTMPIVGSF
jgi:hypothetical protein